MSLNLKLMGCVNIPNGTDMGVGTGFYGTIGNQPNVAQEGADIFINTKSELKKISGIGGAFSEQGGKAIAALSAKDSDEVAQKLFLNKLNFFRMPVGANDFALSAYSLNDEEDDFEMKSFSVKRDEEYIVPYMQMCKKYCGDMRVHASPWSPPWWLKDNKAYGNGGSVIDEDKYYTAYAKYVYNFLMQYKGLGFDIERYCIQNEPDVDPKYPSCIMPAKQMGKFIRVLHDELTKNNVDTEIWAGTFRSLNGPSACDFLTENPGIENIIKGIGCQYTLTQQFYDVRMIAPNLNLMHTESNCFHGENSWEQAVILFLNIVDCYTAGCDTYTYWNMILNTQSTSTWGWRQNSMITIDEDEKTVKYNPDYHIMSLAAGCVRSNSVRVTYSCRTKRGLAVKGSDGVLRFMVGNFSELKETGKATIDGVPYDLELAPQSISLFELS